MKLRPLPISLREANDFVEAFHRHSKRTQWDGGKFAIAASDGDQMWGVAIVGRPLSRMLDNGVTAEVTRLCVQDGSPKGTCSFLYARCWRAWQAMGGLRMVTYTLASEGGFSLRGAGWRETAAVKLEPAGWTRANRERDWQAAYGQQKLRWEA